MTNKTAIELFNDFLINGEYRKFKQLKQRQDEAKKFLKNKLYEVEGKRYEFSDIGYVAKFVRKEQCEIDQAALIDELTNYIAVPYLVEMEVLSFKPSDEAKPFIKDFLLPQDSYIKPSLNKAGKAYSKVLTGYYDSYPSLLGYKGIVASYAEMDKKISILESKYKKIMKQLQLELSETQKTDLATLSVVRKKPEYDLKKMLDEMGQDFLLSNAEVRLSKLKELFEMGILDKKILNPYKIVVDIRLDFVLQSIQSEQRSWEAMQLRKKKLKSVLTV